MVEKLTTYKLLSPSLYVCAWVMFLHTHRKKHATYHVCCFCTIFHFFLRFGLNDIWYSLNSKYTLICELRGETMCVCNAHNVVQSTLHNLRCVPYVILCIITTSNVNDSRQHVLHTSLFSLACQSISLIEDDYKVSMIKKFNTDFCSLLLSCVCFFFYFWRSKNISRASLKWQHCIHYICSFTESECGWWECEYLCSQD